MAQRYAAVGNGGDLRYDKSSFHRDSFSGVRAANSTPKPVSATSRTTQPVSSAKSVRKLYVERCTARHQALCANEHAAQAKRRDNALEMWRDGIRKCVNAAFGRYQNVLMPAYGRSRLSHWNYSRAARKPSRVHVFWRSSWRSR